MNRESRKRGFSHKAAKTRKTAILFLLVLVVTVWGLVSCEKRFPGGLIKKKCVDCHQKEAEKFKKAKVVHGPVDDGDCELCHRSHGVIGGAYLKVDKKKLCYSCHKHTHDFLKQKHVHGPVKNEECISCHDPHSSMNKDLLKQKGRNLCFICHEKGPFTRQ
ncbi:MAG: hypothetical protein JRF28_08550, partial [Deltaproteobacteria bacterium]|nr:hypothetical protein [Deltaproteobacteria bacterium]